MHAVFAIVFAIGAGLAGFAGVVGGSALSVAPGEDVRYLLASLVVVIVGGMGSITGAAIGALLIGLAEQIGLVYFPTYGVVAHLRHHGRRRSRSGRRASWGGRDEPGLATTGRAGRQRRSARIGARAHRARGRAACSIRSSRADFFLTQIGGYSLILGHARAVADAACRLWRHGQPGADHRCRRRRPIRSRSSATTTPRCYGFGWPWWIYVPVALVIRRRSPRR